MRKSVLAILAVAVLALTGAYAQQPKQQQPPKPAPPAVDETLAAWNEVGGKLIAMAQDFPEDKYDYKPTPETRTFRAQLLHVAGSNYYFLEPVAGKKMGDAENDPNPANYKTKAAVVAYLKKSFDDGAALIKQGGDAGLAKEIRAGRNMHRAQAWWTVATGHGAEHYGQLVVYYRLNKMVPPASR